MMAVWGGRSVSEAIVTEWAWERDRYFLLTTLDWQKPDGKVLEGALQLIFKTQKVTEGDKRLKGRKNNRENSF